MTGKEGTENFELLSNSPAQTVGLGETIGSSLTGGEIIALSGPLGSGKTHLIKGIAAGLGVIDADEVNSPTFVLVNEYADSEGRFDIYHIDAYRLDSVTEFEMLGFDDLCYPNSVVMIEWADKVYAALAQLDCIDIELAHVNENQRRLKIKNPPEYLLKNLAP